MAILPQINLILRKRCPILLFQHDLIEYHLVNQRWYKMWFRSFAIPRAVRLADRIVSVSRSTTEDMRKFLGTPLEKVVTIHSGVDLERFGPRDPAESAWRIRDKYGIEAPYVLYVGTLTLPQKNLIRLVEAFNLVLQRRGGIKLLLAGAMGKDSHLILRRIAELGLDQQVILPGYVDDDDLAYLYSAAGVFSFPSEYEGLGMPVLEAMACGCPVVTSNVSSLPEVADGAALLVDPHDTQAIATAIDKAMYDTELRQMLVKEGFARAREFSWEKAAGRLLEVINSFGQRP